MERLRPYERNPQTHSPEQVAGIVRSIEAYGFRDPIGVLPDGTIVEGHGRLEALRQLGRDDVPVLVLHNMTDEEARAYRIAHNGHQKAALWDWSTLADEIAAMASADLDLGSLGLSDGELASLARASDGDNAAPWIGGDTGGGTGGSGSNLRRTSSSGAVLMTWGDLGLLLPGALYERVVATLDPEDAQSGFERLIERGLA